MPERSMGRRRAAFVYRRLAGEMGGKWRSEELARVKGLPVALRRQGLATTTADLIHRAGEKRVDGRVVDLLAEWLLAEMPGRPLADWAAESGDRAALLEAVTRADRPSYLAAQREALALLGQIKLYAEALAVPSREGGGHA
jgi:hypothetical protein